jgi:hypothetical protein
VTRIVTVPAVRGNLAFGSPGIVGLICARSLRHERMMPMQLKHLNLATSDVGGLALFCDRYFWFKRLAARGQDAFALMCNQDEFVLTLMKAKKHDPAAYPETFHVGFYVGVPDAVQAKHDELSQAGLSPGKVRPVRASRCEREKAGRAHCPVPDARGTNRARRDGMPDISVFILRRGSDESPHGIQ